MKNHGHRALRILLPLALGLILIAARPAWGEDPLEQKQAGDIITADEVMAKLSEHEFTDNTEGVFKLTMEDKNKLKKSYRFRIKRQGKNVLIRVLTPLPGVKNTGFLILGEGLAQGEKPKIYMYLPAPINDYREIKVEDAKSDRRFLGSDFDITDFQVRNPEATINKLLRTETVHGIECHVIESTPADPDYKYKKSIIWVRSDDWLPLHIEFYDHQDQVVKDMKVYKFKTLEGKKIPSTLVMESLENKHKSTLELEVEQMNFNADFPENAFTVESLSHPENED